MEQEEIIVSCCNSISRIINPSIKKKRNCDFFSLKETKNNFRFEFRYENN